MNSNHAYDDDQMLIKMNRHQSQHVLVAGAAVADQRGLLPGHLASYEAGLLLPVNEYLGIVLDLERVERSLRVPHVWRGAWGNHNCQVDYTTACCKPSDSPSSTRPRMRARFDFSSYHNIDIDVWWLWLS